MQCNIENPETTKANEIEEKINKENLSRKIDHDLKQNTKQVYILGDSNLKHVKGYTNDYAKDFPGTRVRCMKDYVNPLSVNLTKWSNTVRLTILWG